MSGGGGSGLNYGPIGETSDGEVRGSGGAQHSVVCESLTFEAPVVSPDPTVASSLIVGTVCEVLLKGHPPQLRLYLRREGTLLGAIIERWSDLTSCINAGFSFEAEVLQVTPTIRVRVRPRELRTLTFPMRVPLVEVHTGTTLQAGDRHEVLLTPSNRVVVGDNIATPVGRILAEPVSLPDALRAGPRLSATIESDDPPSVIVERL